MKFALMQYSEDTQRYQVIRKYRTFGAAYEAMQKAEKKLGKIFKIDRL